MAKNGWGFTESRPGGSGSGVMTSNVLDEHPGPKGNGKPGKTSQKTSAEPQEEEFTKENLLFLKAWLEASLKDVNETLAKL